MRTHYERYTTGLTLYAKERPLDTGTWANGIVVGTENGTTGEHAFVLGNGPYELFLQLGGSPADTDTPIGYVPASDAEADGEVTRSTEDTKPIYFGMDAASPLPTGTVSIDGGSFVAVAGAITRAAVYDLAGVYYFQLAYDAADRPTEEGIAVYRIDDGTQVFEFVLIVVPAGGDITSINGTALAETSAGNIASNLATFFDNADAATASVVDDVGAVVVDTASIVSGVVAGLVANGTVTVESAVASDGVTVTVLRGDDYLSGDEITWTVATDDGWPDLTGATLKLTVNGKRLDESFVPTVVTPTGTQSFKLALTNDETIAMPSGVYSYDVQATLADGRVKTLVRPSEWIVEKTYTDPAGL